MEPALLNPADSIGIVVFVTNPNETEEIPSLDWTARIVNVRSLESRPPETVTEQLGRGFLSIKVTHFGWSVYLLGVLAICLFAAAILLGARYGRLTPFPASQIALLAVIMALSFSSSEIVVDILVEGNTSQWWGAWLLLSLHPLLFAYLVWPRIKSGFR